MTLTSAADYLEWNPSATQGLELLQIWLAFERSPTHLVEQRQYRLPDRENRWLQVARPHGHNEHRLEAGDAALITEEGMVEVETHRPTELMLVDIQL
jgi:Quercetinase C-terminal cupin domain